MGLLVASVLALSTPAAAFAALPEGVDTSHYQHSPSLDWSAVRNSGVRFAFLKATEGSSYTDPWFAADWAATKKVGIYHGAYHFARPSVGSAATQAKYFVSRIGTQTSPGTLPPVLDLEATGGLSSGQLITWTQQWLTAVAQLTGRTPMIYVSPAFWKYNLANSTAFHDYPLWIANYGVSQPTVPGGWPTWTFWQGSSSGRVPGISGNVDTDVFNGSLSQLQKMALAYAPAPATLALTASNPAPTSGQSVTFAGTMLDSSGAPVAGKTVWLNTRLPGTTSWTRAATVTTSAKGAYAVTLPVTAAASYRARFPGDSQYAAAVSRVARVALTPIPTTLSLTSTSDDVLAGATVTLTGALAGSGALGNVPVTVERQAPGIHDLDGGEVGHHDQHRHLRRTAHDDDVGRVPGHLRRHPAYAPATSPSRKITVSRAATSASLRVSNAAPFQGGRVRITGTLANGTAPVAGRTVTVVRQAAGTTAWTSIGTATSDDLGHYVLSIAADGAGTYRADFAGDALYLPTSSETQSITITPPAPTVLTLQAPASKLRRGATMTLSGLLRTSAGSPLVGRNVILWKRLVGTSSWYRVGHVRTASTGSWQPSVAPTKSAVYRAYWRGGSRYAASRSTAARISVR